MKLITYLTNAFMLTYIGFIGVFAAWIEYSLFVQRKWGYFVVMTFIYGLFAAYVHWAWSNSVFTLSGKRNGK